MSKKCLYLLKTAGNCFNISAAQKPLVATGRLSNDYNVPNTHAVMWSAGGTVDPVEVLGGQMRRLREDG